MFALRRIAVRAIQRQPTRQLPALRPVASAFPSKTTPFSRSFYQSQRRFAEEEQKKESSAEAAGTKPVTEEPSIEQQRSEIKEQSVTSPEVADAGQATTSAPAEPAEQSTIESAKESISSAAQAVSRTASSAAGAASSFFPPRSNNSSVGPGQSKKILYIGNLFFEVTLADLESEFGQYGDIANSRIVTDDRGMSKGFGYIEFSTQDAADRAIRELDQKVFHGRRMAVQHHVPRDPRVHKTRQDNPVSKTLFIGNMSYQMSDRDLNDLFRDIRNVLDVRVAIDRRSGQPRGFAHADFVDTASAEKAKAILDKKVVYGRELRVDYSASSASRKESS